MESTYLPGHNARYAVAPAGPVDYHVPRDPELCDEDVFCLEHTRTVGQDLVVQFGRRGLQLDRKARGWVPAGSKVIVREARNGRIRVIHVSRLYGERECRWMPAAPRAKKPEPAKTALVPEVPTNRNRPAADHSCRRAIMIEPVTRL